MSKVVGAFCGTMVASTQFQCGGRTCSQGGKCSDWKPIFGDKYERRNDGTYRDNTDTLYYVLFDAGLDVVDARPSARIAIRILRAYAADRCRRAADDLKAAFKAGIRNGDFGDVFIDALTRVGMTAFDVDRARGEDGYVILKAVDAVRAAQHDHVCHCE